MIEWRGITFSPGEAQVRGEQTKTEPAEHISLHTVAHTAQRVSAAGKSGAAPDQVRLAPNGTNLGLFKISFSTLWRAAPKCTETDLKMSQICPIWG